MRRVLAVLVSSLVVGCGIPISLPKPKPMPTPTPTPPPVVEPACPELNVPWCHEVGLHCGACKHQPPGERCAIQAPACPEPPKEEPPAKPPAQPPASCDLRESDLEEALVQRAAMLTAAVVAAQSRVAPSSDPHVSLALLAAEMRAAGYCSIAGQEALFTVAADGLVEEHHAVFFGNGGWIANGKYMGVHKRKQSACGDPRPTELRRVQLDQYTGPNRTRVDATLVFGGCEFCAAIGMGEMGGVKRCGCPARPEGHPERFACEALWPIRWSATAGFADDTNPAVWIVPRGVRAEVTACAGSECNTATVEP